MLCIYDKEENLYVWACESRNSDQLMIVVGNEKNINNMFSDNAYDRAEYFSYQNYDLAVDCVYSKLNFYFNLFENKKVHFKFDIHQNIQALQKIQADAKSLNYEDYYELATFCDETNHYSCDLVIVEGKMGLRYNIGSDIDIKNESFESIDINLDNEGTLMLDMQKHLRNFMKNEIEYQAIFREVKI